LSPRRFWLVASLDAGESARRPLFWLWTAVMGFNAWLLSRGNWIYRSVDTSLGSPRAFVNSEFQVAFVMALLGFLLVSFFVAVVAGMPLIRDAERKVGEILGATPLTPGEYVWGKFAAALVSCLAVMAAFVAILVLFVHGLPDAAIPESYGPASAAAYLRPFVMLVLPGLVFTAGAAFLIGQATGKPILVFLLPVILLPYLQNFVWRWFPPDLGPGAGAALRLLDPSGFRWLKETWLRVDRGIAFYNTRPIVYDAPFVASRIGWVLCGLLLVEVARRRFARRSPGGGVRWRRAAKVAGAGVMGGTAAGAADEGTGGPVSGRSGGVPGGVAAGGSLGELSMRGRPPGFFSGAWTVARFELAEIAAQPGLYIFLPFIVLFLLVAFRADGGPFGGGVLLTAGTAAVRGMLVLTPWLCLLMLFYTVESLQRERSTGLGPIFYATPVPTPSLLAGKALANLAVAGVTLLASFATAAYVMNSQGRVAIELWPFGLVWGLLFVPTLLVWTAFVTAAYAATGSRYVTYGIGLAVLVATLFALLHGDMSWAGNWALVGALPWSDLGTFEIDRRALWLNRLEVLALVPLLAFVAVRWFGRREGDRLAGGGRGPGARRRTAPRLAALAAAPVALALALQGVVEAGFQGSAVTRRHKDYWRQNVATWSEAPLPFVSHVELDLDLEPATRGFAVAGSYDLVNRKTAAISWFPMTGGFAWRDLVWTFDGKPYRPEEREERTGLFVFKQPLAPGSTHRLGFRYRGVMLPGVSRNGGELALGEFMLPSGVLVTGRNPDFVPVLGFKRDLGIDDENRFEPKRFPPDFWRQELEAEIDRSAFTSRLRITAPAEYTVNSTGVLRAVTTTDGRRARRTWVWESDYPLRVFNVAAGRWAVRRGQGTAVYFDPRHHYNVDSMLAGLDGARRWYAEWFGPYPWRDLRLNEFPAVAQYARGNATNIFFSEGVGFLAVPGGLRDAAFTITAHEAAHQWWGHILAAGEGPGGIVLAEGAAHFSTMLLLEQVRGPAARIAFATDIEGEYGEQRSPGTEKALAEATQFRGSDTVVIYDKGGWAFWMLLQQMGREAFLAGARNFIARYHLAAGHPVIQHFVAAMRPYAADKGGFDAVSRQWFFERVIPEYRVGEARKARSQQEWEVVARVANAGTGRMPVEVAAASQGERFDESGRLVPGYRDARATVVLGPGEEKEVRIRCGFEPRRVVVDPDAKVMQLQRKAAIFRF
jgi:ABC-2 type transport system permease protein